MSERKHKPCVFAGRKAWPALASVALCFAGATNSSADHRVAMLPRLHAGQALHYQIHGRLQRDVTTESRVTSMAKPADLKEDISLELQITIREIRVENGRPVVVARGEFQFPNDAADRKAQAANPGVDFTIDGTGQAQKVEGLENLDPEQRLVWQFWIARFAYGWTLPADGVKPRQTWKTEESERTPGPIANLVWDQQTTYGQNDKCATMPTEKCAVFLTTAKLKQKSSPKDATPEDYKLHELKTSGTTSGTNEIFTSISLKSGLVLRATEDAKQSMDVEIAKIDKSNAVHYKMDVSSRFEMLMVPESKTQLR
ncbi:MAG TPA: hypothetical protein VGF61_07105 [Candidatus Acidoferrum sp.]|jgi:hypothetical protein